MYNRKIQAVFIITVFLLAIGLTNVQAQTGADNSTSSSIPQTAKAQVYFYRLKAFTGSALEPLIVCDDKPVAKMDNGRYFAIELDPGVHSCFVSDKKSGFEADLKAGDVKYAKITIEAGFWKGHGIITLVQPEQATFEIKKLKLLGKNKIKDKELVTVYEKEKP